MSEINEVKVLIQDAVNAEQKETENYAALRTIYKLRCNAKVELRRKD